jgi:L-lactate dehydrogenase complex protein LldG
MPARESILASIRERRPPGDHPLPSIPRFPQDLPAGRIGEFARNLKMMGGRILEADTVSAALDQSRAQLKVAGVVCSVVPEIAGNKSLESLAAPGELADVDVAVVRATLGVAETGSVLFTDTDLKINALGYLAQHLVVLLDPADIIESIQDAYRRPEFRLSRYVVFHSGPSATGDIEGVLIHGAQGVRSLTVIFVPDRANAEGRHTGY